MYVMFCVRIMSYVCWASVPGQVFFRLSFLQFSPSSNLHPLSSFLHSRIAGHSFTLSVILTYDFYIVYLSFDVCFHKSSISVSFIICSPLIHHPCRQLSVHHSSIIHISFIHSSAISVSSIISPLLTHHPYFILHSSIINLFITHFQPFHHLLLIIPSSTMHWSII